MSVKDRLSVVTGETAIELRSESAEARISDKNPTIRTSQ